MTEAEKRLHRCCFTGHRPEKMDHSEEIVVQKLERAIRAAIARGLTVFIVGMAPGVDILAGEIVIRLRDEEGLPLRLIAAEPHLDFDKRWDAHWQKRYHFVLESSDHKTVVCKHNRPSAYQERNRFMVDHSAYVIAYWSGGSGGTRNTVLYAEKAGVPVENVYES